MIDNLIQQYINRMTTDDINKFALNYGISLQDTEQNLLFTLIKKDWRTLVYGNPRPILDNLKATLEPFTYQKIETLFIFFKEKYRSYL